ncbi:MAG: hypothetical protein WCO57_09955 [Verrucomicrobiota bacterium]
MSDDGSNIQLTGESPNPESLAPLARKTGVPPVREDSASRLSADEATGWKPVGHDRRDACPPANLTVLSETSTDAGRKEEATGTSSLQKRRSLLRAAAWAGGIAGLGGLSGLGLSQLTRRTPQAPSAKPPLGADFTYDVARFQTSDPALLRYEESARFASGLERARAIAVAADGTIFVGGTGGLRKFSPTGEVLLSIPLEQAVVSVALRQSGEIMVGQPGKITVLDAGGAGVAVWSGLPAGLLPTAMAVAGERVFVADAGNRVVQVLDAAGKPVGVIGARDPARNLKGFVVPSPYFCVRMAPDGLLRVTNPGEHQIEAFTLEGDLELAWGKGSFAVEGFCGCCNPVSFDMFPDGGFVTCEKGLPRVKLYNSAGEFTGLVAGPEAFPEYLQAANAGTPDSLGSGIYAAINPQGHILILDSVSGSIRIMQRKPQAHD